MGVKGFNRYIKDKLKDKEEKLILSDIAKNKSLDGPAFYHRLASKLSLFGSFVQLRNEIVEYFDRLKKFNIQPIVFLDGLTPSDKHKALEKRYFDKVKKMNGVSKLLKDSKPFTEEDYNDIKIKMVAVEFKRVLEELNILTYVAFQETDYEITQWAADNKDVFAIISTDSDYYFSKMGNSYFILYDNFVVKDESIEAKGSKSKMVADCLNIKVKQLPLLAILMGNDITEFIIENTQNKQVKRVIDYSTNTQARITNIIDSLKKSKKCSLNQTLKNYFRNKDDIEKCLNSYHNYRSRGRSKEGFVKNGLFFRNSPHLPSGIMYKPYYQRFFSFSTAGCMIDYNYLSALYSPMNQVSTYCNDLVSYSPTPEGLPEIKSSFSIDDCYRTMITLDNRIYEFASWFKVLEQPKLLEYSKRYSGPAVASARYQCFDDLLMILSSVEVMNIPSNIQCHLKSPHQVLDSTNLHLLWQSATKRLVGIPPTTAGNATDRLGHLFPSFKDNITEDHLQHFNYLKNEIYSNLKLSNDATTTTTTTNQSINQ
ncbi:hypothetical protein PPL_05719 [Heterostelium album PN500]|uniref:Asteroid domain-containing protein n=1 Tax=Heterostelium pallidum (strain ATCC 26659 / Pp 5 / PN500) TaxID=670386 RepID=D3BAY8_HETP5|nr:hypothetical protein PPL_05719 [Heterostelium album PN500]EFA81725.1 hypothetical protein PPL_05719 [Heterostelium album PN500]|eukprot:XP_020433842.1 hypothetical protein PPL_05719 [Heterostelium album PN500]